MDKSYSVKILSEGNSQWNPDISPEKFQQDFNNREGLMKRNDEEYWTVKSNSFFKGRSELYFYKNDKNNNIVVSYDLNKLIDYKIPE